MARLLRYTWICLFACVFVLAAGGCAGDSGVSDSSSDTDQSTTQPAEETNADSVETEGEDTEAPAVDGVQAPSMSDIPDGTDVSSGGNPEYTFLTLWKRGLEQALTWQSDAYLVSASGRYVNDSGIPSEWSMVFQSPTATGFEWCVATVDPWGNAAIEIRTPNGTDTQKQAARDVFGTTPITPDIIDSDVAVATAAPVLYECYSRDKTKEPMLMLHYDREDADSGPLWDYQVFYRSTAEYVAQLVDARTGEVIIAEEP